MAAEKAYKESFAVIWRKHKYKYLMIAPFGIIFIVFTLLPVLVAGEFCYTWERQPYANNALLYLKQGSLLNERITSKALELETFRPWRLFAYQDRGLSSYIVYPSAFFDPL